MGFPLTELIRVGEVIPGESGARSKPFPTRAGRWLVGIDYIKGDETRIQSIQLELSGTESFEEAFPLTQGDFMGPVEVLTEALTETTKIAKAYISADKGGLVPFTCLAGLWARWVVDFIGTVTPETGGTIRILLGVEGADVPLRGRTP